MPIIYRGEVVGHTTRKANALLIYMSKNLRGWHKRNVRAAEAQPPRLQPAAAPSAPKPLTSANIMVTDADGVNHPLSEVDDA